MFTVLPPTHYVWAKMIPCMLSNDQRALHVHLTITHLLHGRNDGNAFLHCTLSIKESWMQSLDTPSPAETTERWMAHARVTEEGNCTAQSACSGTQAHYALQPKWFCAWPSHANSNNSQWMILLLTLSGQTRPALHRKQPEMMEHGVIFSKTMQHITIIMCKIWCSNGTGMCWHILPSL